ncbi:hypothetical protein J5X84_16780 [Streptosporangiaceae bacterium NEAU-GS5]|nr:hypothetical protein [Streptosporangiaceae bacterium NEAU-GS5]
MRKVRALLAAGILVSGLTVVATATPAQADTLRNVYYGYTDCNSYGSYGVQNGLWLWYHCEYQYNFYFLWSVP